MSNNLGLECIEQDFITLQRIVAILLKRAGGSVEITLKEFQEVDTRITATKNNLEVTVTPDGTRVRLAFIEGADS